MYFIISFFFLHILIESSQGTVSIKHPGIINAFGCGAKSRVQIAKSYSEPSATGMWLT